MSDGLSSAIAHLYRRAGFGAGLDEVAAGVVRGYEATVELLLAGLSGPDPAGDAVPRPALAAPAAGGGDPQSRTGQRQELLALQQWWLERMVVTATPLREKLTLLWHGHFATGARKVRDAGYMYRQNELFRSLGGGSFEALVQALARDPAMLIWLDARSDVAAHPNENFARELMELFTLGLGNYSEDDVRAAARCFTGWGFDPASGAFVERARRHDSGVKTFLGRSGDFDGGDVVSIVTHQPASARWVTARLWSHLAYPVAAGDPRLDALAAGYARDLDVTGLLRAILLHPEFGGPTARAGLVKQPVEYVVGAVRAFGLHTGDFDVRPTLGALNQVLFDPPSVGGWGQNGYWLDTATAEVRLRFGTALARRADLAWLAAHPPAGRLDALAGHLSIDGWGPTSAAALEPLAADPTRLVAVALSAPEYVLN
ncbi:MAG TPA: DUF1800 domain-containing protein [Acidimicrobiia bacterium]|nr:DUF1800 domain-containing protein [Acidimicrobiia bacterium]